MPLLILSSLRAIWALRGDPQFVALGVLAAVAIVSGTGFYSLVEGLRLVDAFYFSVVTLTTVGYGDFTPQTDVGKLFTAVYALVGIGIFLAFITTVATKVSQTPLLAGFGETAHGRSAASKTSGGDTRVSASADGDDQRRLVTLGA